MTSRFGSFIGINWKSAYNILFNDALRRKGMCMTCFGKSKFYLLHRGDKVERVDLRPAVKNARRADVLNPH